MRHLTQRNELEVCNEDAVGFEYSEHIRLIQGLCRRILVVHRILASWPAAYAIPFCFGKPAVRVLPMQSVPNASTIEPCVALLYVVAVGIRNWSSRVDFLRILASCER